MRLTLGLLLTFLIHNCASAQELPLVVKGDRIAVDLAVQEVEILNAYEARVGWGYGFPNQQLIDYFASENMRKQMEFTEAQHQQFKDLRKEYQKEYTKVLQRELKISSATLRVLCRLTEVRIDND